jgi:hypothetical protein
MVAVQAAAARSPAASQGLVRDLIETGWLLAACMTPLIVMHETSMVGFIQIPKVAVMRTMALAVAALLAIDWATLRRSRAAQPGPGVWRSLRADPGRAIYYGAAAVLAAHLVSVAFSPIRTVSIWGIDPGWDTYALYNLVAYLMLFLGVALHMRSLEQLRRLMWLLTAVSILFSLYGVAQHFGIDPMRVDPKAAARAPLSFGNPIFGGAFLVMTVPLTLALVMPMSSRLSAIRHLLLGAALITPQLTAMVFILSRGPVVALLVGLGTFVFLMGWLFGRELAGRTAAITIVATAGALLASLIPISGSVDAPEDTFGARLVQAVPGVGTGLGSRLNIWRTAVDTMFSVYWVDTEAFPELPELSFKPLRPLVGYGPDMFTFAYPLAGSSKFTSTLASHGHSFAVHTGLELGLIGLAAYASLFGAVSLVLYRMLRMARGGAYPRWFAFALAGLASVLVGRFVEQLPGKAQVSDLVLSWIFAGVVIAVANIRFSDGSGDQLPAPRRRRGRAAHAGAAAPLNLFKVTLAGVFTLGVIVFWFSTVFSIITSAVISREAETAAREGRLTEAISGYSRAIQAAESPISRIRLAQALFDAGSSQADVGRRDQLWDLAYEETQVVLRRNPMDHRAWSRAGEFDREMGVMREVPWEEATRDSLVFSTLMPGFWQARAGLAWSYVRLGRNELALETAAYARTLGVEGGDSFLIPYVEAVAYRALGQRDDALAAALESMENQPTIAAQELIRQLRDELAPDQGSG